MIRWQGGVSIATVIDVASELSADGGGGDQHGGQLMFQRCSLSRFLTSKVADKIN